MKIKMHFTKPKAVLFDWDNTLVISRSMMYLALNETINKINADPNILSSSQFEKAKHLSTKDAFPQIFGDKWQEAFKVYDKYFQANHLQQIKLMPAAKDFLELLLTNQIPMSIVSNKEGLYLRKEVEEFQLNKYFYNIVGSMDANEDKPSPEPVKLAMVGMDIKKCSHDIWFIGDSIVDLRCAHNTGCLPILFGENLEDIDKAKKENISHLQVVDFYQMLNLYQNIQ